MRGRGLKVKKKNKKKKKLQFTIPLIKNTQEGDLKERGGGGGGGGDIKNPLIKNQHSGREIWGKKRAKYQTILNAHLFF